MGKVQSAATAMKKISSDCNIIELKMKIEQSDVNKIIYFLDNTNGKYFENGDDVIHIHDNLKKLNKRNTILIINEKKLPFSKSFIPKKNGIYSIKLIFKKKLTNCAYMFYNCKNIIDIDFSKFDTKNVIDMKYMFGCISLKTLNLSSFNTKNVKDMSNMFYKCYFLKTINLSSFNIKKCKKYDGYVQWMLFITIIT